MIGRTLGRYRIVGKLGQGGMATVWKAQDPLLRRTVALKVLAESLVGSPEAERRFLREARAASALNHPSAVAVHDFGAAAGHLYIAFACIDGETVSDRAARAPYSNDAAIALGIAVADTLAHAHAKGIVHRDITSRNVMVDGDDRAFVLDFGLAWISGTVRLTSTSATLGTYAYMAPETAAGSTADARSDLYGLGVVLYEAVTGTLPFRGDSPGATLYAVMHDPPEPPRHRRPGVDAGLERIVLRLLEKDPGLRYQSAEEVVAALRELSPTLPRSPGMRSGPPVPTSAAGASAALSYARHERVLPDHPFLAVLPFLDIASSEDPDGARAVFAQGLAGSIGAALGRHSDIHVVPAPQAPEGASLEDLEGLARSLGANLFLSGSVRRSGVHLRVSYSLLHPYRRIQIAGDAIDGSVAELFDLEDRLVLSVVRALGLEPAPARRHRTTRDPAAHERFVQALGYLQRYENEAHVDAAIHLLEELIESDPTSAGARAVLGRACLFKYRLTAERR